MPTILVVDDSAVSRRLLGHTLRANGYSVLTADNGHDALALLCDQPADLVIADLAMPKMDGLALLRALRADQRLCKICLVMLTASGADQDRIAAREAGADDFLTKPTSSGELLSLVARLLPAESLLP